ncbi:MAG: SRPBCC family protein [Tepidiformaceae bacterium]
MTTQSTSTLPITPASDDYAYAMHVHASAQAAIAAVSDGEEICRWWTAVVRFERHGKELQLFTNDGPMVSFALDDAPDPGKVTWTVTACMVEDWVGTRPSFSVLQQDDGTCAIEFRHVGLRPALECFDQCRAGWAHFMPSLRQFLETGVGRPNEPRDPSA